MMDKAKRIWIVVARFCSQCRRPELQPLSIEISLPVLGRRSDNNHSMPTKSEIEAGYHSYRDATAAVGKALAATDYPEAVRLAEASLTMAHTAITYQRRVLKSNSPIAPTVDCLLRFAPPLFLRRSLDTVEQWYNGGTRAERKALPDMPKRITHARHMLAHATQLWSFLIAKPVWHLRSENLSTAESELVAVWLSSGYVEQKNSTTGKCYARVSDPRRSVCGKCSQCGTFLSAALEQFLDPMPCPRCHLRCEFVITGRVG